MGGAIATISTKGTTRKIINCTFDSNEAANGEVQSTPIFIMILPVYININFYSFFFV
jgi:hypothetical protein